MISHSVPASGKTHGSLFLLLLIASLAVLVSRSMSFHCRLRAALLVPLWIKFRFGLYKSTITSALKAIYYFLDAPFPPVLLPLSQ